MIEINNLTAKSINKEFLKKVAQKILKEENRKKLNLSIALVEPPPIRELNRKYRKKNQATDSLSFLYNDSGEIVICPLEVKKNVKRFTSSFKKELARALIHGILHLLGYDHRERKKGKKMQKKEEHYLSEIELS
jgi:probable rRNA maturation factor